MKPFLLALLSLLLLIASGCEKDDAVTFPNLTGTWELRTSMSGWGERTDYDAGNGNTIRFTGDNYERVMHGTRSSGKYKLKDDVSILTDTPIKRIFYYKVLSNIDEDQPGRSHVQVARDTLTIAMDVYDGDALTYIKIAH